MSDEDEAADMEDEQVCDHNDKIGPVHIGHRGARKYHMQKMETNSCQFECSHSNASNNKGFASKFLCKPVNGAKAIVEVLTSVFLESIL